MMTQREEKFFKEVVQQKKTETNWARRTKVMKRERKKW
jgi:hypothetical protein